MSSCAGGAQWDGEKPLQAGHAVAARASSDGEWYLAKVIKLNADKTKVKVHFNGWNRRYDEWVDVPPAVGMDPEAAVGTPVAVATVQQLEQYLESQAPPLPVVPSLVAPACPVTPRPPTPATASAPELRPTVIEGCSAILAAMLAERAPGQLRELWPTFAEIPSATDFPDYQRKVAQPISIAEIEAKISSKHGVSYSSISECLADVRLMVDNAKTYNPVGSGRNWIRRDAAQLLRAAERAAEKQTRLGHSGFKNLRSPSVVCGAVRPVKNGYTVQVGPESCRAFYCPLSLRRHPPRIFAGVYSSHSLAESALESTALHAACFSALELPQTHSRQLMCGTCRKTFELFCAVGVRGAPLPTQNADTGPPWLCVPCSTKINELADLWGNLNSFDQRRPLDLHAIQQQWWNADRQIVDKALVLRRSQRTLMRISAALAARLATLKTKVVWQKRKRSIRQVAGIKAHDLYAQTGQALRKIVDAPALAEVTRDSITSKQAGGTRASDEEEKILSCSSKDHYS